MVVQLRPRTIIVDRGSRGFGLSLIYRGLDKYEEKDTGIFVARVVPGGQAARCGVRENDKIVTINGKTPRNVDDAVGVIKQAGNQIKVVVLREEDVPDIHLPEGEQSIGERDPTWVRHLHTRTSFRRHIQYIITLRESTREWGFHFSCKIRSDSNPSPARDRRGLSTPRSGGRRWRRRALCRSGRSSASRCRRRSR